MLAVAKQASPSSMIREVLTEFLKSHFDNDDTKAPTLVIAVSQLYKAVNNHSPEILRGLKPDAFARYIDMISTEGQMPMLSSTGPSNTRVLTFNRTDFASPSDKPEPPPEMGEGNFNAPTHDNP